ncbi:tetratricopeptide repeat protein [Patescibacteria group bacterium]
MSLTGKQKKYIKKYLKKKPIENIAKNLHVSVEEIENYLEKRWGKQKLARFIKKTAKNKGLDNWQGRVLAFNFKLWLKDNLKYLILLTVLVFAVYVNSFGNDLVSDDVGGIRDNPDIGNFGYVFANPPTVFHPLTYYVTYSLFGRIPTPYRVMNVFFHLGNVFVVYLFIFLLVGPTAALFSAALLAVHPLEIEAVGWISGGIYAKYSFFILLGLLLYMLSKKGKKYYIFSFISFLMALLTSEKAIFFPFALLAFVLSFENIKKAWKKLIAPFILGSLWIGLYVMRVGERITDLAVDHYSRPQTLNPLTQIPIAISSYLQYIFWPFGLTLYHSEMHFSTPSFILRAIVFVIYMAVIIYSFWKNKKLSFWMAFLLIALSPTLTPFGISWIVAERYAYLGAIGIFISIAIGLSKLAAKFDKKAVYLLFTFIIVGLSIRTIVRNIDWKNQDNLWLAAAKTSPSSPQNHNNLGDLFARRGDFPKAAEEFSIAIQLKPGYADAYHNLANTYRQMGNNELAIENYQQALKFNPRIWQSHQNLAAIFFEGQDLIKAEEHMGKAVVLNPQNPDLRAKLGLVLLNGGKVDKARQELSIALQIDPQNEMAKSLLSQLSTQ